MAITVCPCTSGLSTVLVAVGNLTLTPCCSIGATSIMMISSTSMTSTSGVTLISDLTPPLAPPTSIAITKSPCEKPNPWAKWVEGLVGSSWNPRDLPDQPDLPVSGGLLNEIVDELRRGVVHLDVEVLDAPGEIVVEPHG